MRPGSAEVNFEGVISLLGEPGSRKPIRDQFFSAALHPCPSGRQPASGRRPSICLCGLAPEHRVRNPSRGLLWLPAGRRRDHLVRRTIRDAVQGVRDARQFVYQLIAHRRFLHNDRSPAPELLHRPGSRRNDENEDCQELFIACDGDGPAEKVKDMVREQFFLPAGAPWNNYLFIGCLLVSQRQPNSLSVGLLSPHYLRVLASLP